MTIKEINDLLNKNIEEGRKIGELSIGSLLKNLPASSEQVSFFHNFFTTSKITLSFVKPVLEGKKLSIQFLNRQILNAKDVTIEISFDLEHSFDDVGPRHFKIRVILK